MKKSALAGALCLALAIIAAVCLVLHLNWSRKETKPDGELLRVCFIDAGQGDATLIYSADGAVLIDTGLYENRFRLVSYIKSLGIRRLDYLVITHAHSDHYGGAEEIIGNFEIGTSVIGGGESNAYGYEKMLLALDGKKVNTVAPFVGYGFSLGEARFSFLSPLDEYDDENERSSVIRLTLGETSFLFCGDISSVGEERQISEYGQRLKSNVLKLSHHGSSSGSGENFLRLVSPTFAVASCGCNNDYDHPAFG